MRFSGGAKRLSPNDISVIAGYLGCEVAVVNAVLAIESRGKGFDDEGRPLILNEPHIFYRALGRDEKRNRAVRAGLAYKKWGTKPYPRTQDLRYVWLDLAMQIDQSAALQACSWGLGQVLGSNYKSCGFDTVQDFVETNVHSEGAQLYCMARFIVAHKLQRYLAAKKWAAFAKGYNGAGYRKNRYDTKLALEYARRPAAEKMVPPPATAAQLDALIHDAPKKPAQNAPAVPLPNPKPVPVQKVGGAAASAIAAAGGAAKAGLPWWGIAAAGIVAAVIVFAILHSLSNKE